MDNLFAGLIASLSIPVIALLFKKLLDKWVSGRTKDVIVRTADGKIVSLTVNANSSDIQIGDSVRRNLIFEQKVRDTLEIMTADLSGFSFHESKKVDFIAQYNGSMVAIECKVKVTRLNKASIEGYLEAEAGLSRLLLVSREPTPIGLVENVKEFIESGQVSLLNAASDADLSKNVSRAVLQVLKSSQNDWQQKPASSH